MERATSFIKVTQSLMSKICPIEPDRGVHGFRFATPQTKTPTTENPPARKIYARLTSHEASFRKRKICVDFGAVID
jgi:hypothetical protein